MICAMLLLFVACSKNSNNSLENTSWGYSWDMGAHRYSLNLNLDSPTRGNAELRENIENEGVQPVEILVIYDIKYTYDEKENSGSVTFAKESSYAYGMTDPSYFPSYFKDTCTSSFYTYAGNNKMFLYSTPCPVLERIDLDRK